MLQLRPPAGGSRRPSRDSGQPPLLPCEELNEAVCEERPPGPQNGLRKSWPETSRPPLQRSRSGSKHSHSELSLPLPENNLLIERPASQDVAEDDDDELSRQVSVFSTSPSNLHMTQVQRRALPRHRRLPSDLEKKAKDLRMDLQGLLPHSGLSHASSNVEFCINSACNVLRHLCLLAELETCQSWDVQVRYSSETSEALGDRPFAPEDGERADAGRKKQKSDAASPEQAQLEGGVDNLGWAQEARRRTNLSSSDNSMTQEERPVGQDSCNALDVGSRRRSFQLRPPDYIDGSEFPTSHNTCYLHPENPFRMGWDLSSMLLILSLSVLIPLEVCFFWEGSMPAPLEVIANLVDIFFMIDIVLNFFTACHDGHGVSGRLVTDFKGIAKRYAKGWLWIDIIASIPWLQLSMLLGADQAEANNGTEAMGMLKVLRYAKVARMMKILRVLKLGSLIQTVEEKMVAAQSMTVAFQLLKMTVVMLIISHNVACGWYAVAFFAEEPQTWLIAQGLDEADEVRQYIASFYFAITTGTTVGYGDIHPENSIEQVVTIFVLVLSVAYVGQFLGRVSQMVSSLRYMEAQATQTKREALLFMKKRAVSKDLQFKVLRYIEHVFETDAVTSLDERIMNLLSESLKNQLALAVTGNVLKQFPLFEHAEESFLTALCQVCRTQRAGVGDTMVSEEQAAHEMFWVVRGEAAVMRQNHHVGGLRTGDWFGELSLFFPGAVRKATVRCETNCEFVVLHHDQFQNTIEEFPKVRRQYEKLAAGMRSGDPPQHWRNVWKVETLAKSKSSN